MEGLGDHLTSRYGIRVGQLSELDAGVFRVDRDEGPAWVARVFPAARPLEEVDGDAAILEALGRHGFPTERCADPEPVSAYEGQGVLVTELVQGARARGGKRTFAVLGELLGRLQARTSDRQSQLRPGGGWHHVTVQGGPREEIAGALALLDAARAGVPEREQGLYETLREALAGSEDCAGLPEALLHPDFVPANAIDSDEGRLVIVDWTGAGRGPRLWSLAFLLLAAGARDLDLVDVVVSRYRSHVRLEPDELARLADAMCVRPLVLDCWSLCHGRKRLAEVAGELAPRRRLVEAVAAKAAAGLS